MAASLDTLQALCMHDLQSCTADCLNRDRASSVAGTSAFNVTDCLSGCLGASYLCLCPSRFDFILSLPHPGGRAHLFLAH